MAIVKKLKKSSYSRSSLVMLSLSVKPDKML